MNLRILRFFFKRKGTYFPRNYYYERLFEKYTDATSYLSIVASVQSKQNIVSQRLISFNKNEFKNTTKQDVYKQYGKPNYQIKTNKVLKTELFFYRVFIGGHRVKLDLHFYNNSLFFYSYTFSYLREDEKYQIVNLIEKKYLDEKPFDYNNFVIIDGKQSIINIIDSMDFTINYICCITSSIFQRVETAISNEKLAAAKKQKMVADELFQKL
ncbi:MAG: hypothetical protein EHM93_03720 [Bacteroidales bacterium]|nr:MAG: hypothetical protein EHM93_03720 [Bacteroidales bacterium]